MIINANALAIPLANKSVHCIVTSPPYYGLRDYGVNGQLGLEESPEEYIANMVTVFKEAWRVLRDDGTLWLNIGDSYSSNSGNNTGKNGYHDGRKNRIKRLAAGAHCNLKPKDLIGIPWMLAFALRAYGWYLRQDIIWHKPNPMPESVTDRCTKAHEYLFLLSKSVRYYYDQEAIRVPVKDSSISRLSQNIEEQEGSERVPGKTNGKMKAVTFGANKAEGYGTRIHSSKEWIPTMGGGGTGLVGHSGNTLADGTVLVSANKKSVWTIPTQGTKEAHFAIFPEKLVEPCILAGCPVGGVVLDPFFGSGTTGMVALKHGRRFVGLDLNMTYLQDIARKRLITQIGFGV